MAIIDGRTWLEILSPRACWDFLAQAKVGRVGVLVDSAPEIYPVNFAVDGHAILFRTDPGSKLRGVVRSPSVCFEVDGFDEVATAGWSVLVKGRARELSHPDEVRHAEHVGVAPWAVGRKAHWIRITPDEVTGRRVQAAVGPPG